MTKISSLKLFGAQLFVVCDNIHCNFSSALDREYASKKASLCIRVSVYQSQPFGYSSSAKLAFSFEDPVQSTAASCNNSALYVKPAEGRGNLTIVAGPRPVYQRCNHRETGDTGCDQMAGSRIFMVVVGTGSVVGL